MEFRRRLWSAGEYLAALLIILECRSVYTQAVEIDLHIPGAAVAALLLLLAMKMEKQSVRKALLRRWTVLVLALSVVLLALSAVSVPRDKLADFILRFWIALPVMVLLFYLDREEGRKLALFAKFSNIMAFLAALSLVFWILASQLHLVAAVGEWNARWLKQNFYANYFGVYFECQTVMFLGYSGFRNISIFCEPSMFSLCLAAALTYELFLRESFNPRGGRVLIDSGKLLVRRHQEFRRAKILLFSVTIITTFATSGIILLLLLLFLKYLGLRPGNIWLRVMKLLSLQGLLVIMGVLIYAVFQIRIPAAAWNSVVRSYTEGLRLWETAPFFGTGYLGNLQAAALLKSNSFFTILAEGGLALFAVYLVPLAGAVVFSFIYRRPGAAALAFAASFELLAVLVPYTYLVLMLLACCFSYLLQMWPEGGSSRMKKTDGG